MACRYKNDYVRAVIKVSETEITALISLCGTALGTLGGIFATNRLTTYRLSQLEKKVDKHNNLIERMYSCEKKLNILEEKHNAVNHRIINLERN